MVFMCRAAAWDWLIDLDIGCNEPIIILQKITITLLFPKAQNRSEKPKFVANSTFVI
jgi:hypothetical protein